MPTVGVFAALFDDLERILLVRRSYGHRNWTTPGGRMDRTGARNHHRLLRSPSLAKAIELQ